MPEEPAAQVDDAEIILRMMDRDEEGLEMLLKGHGPTVYGWLVKNHGHTIADEALNRAGWNAWRFANRYDESKGSLGGWFLRIAQRAALDIYRRERRHCRKSLEYDPKYDPVGEDPETVEGDDEAERKVRERDERKLREIINRLPPLQRAIVRADLAEDDTVEAEILAERFDSSVNSIHVQRSKARRTIREEVTRQGLFQN